MPFPATARQPRHLAAQLDPHMIRPDLRHRRAHLDHPPPLPPARATGVIIRSTSRPSRHATSARVTSGDASQRGTLPSGAAIGGTAASDTGAHLPHPYRPAPPATAGHTRPRPTSRQSLSGGRAPIRLCLQSGLLLEHTFRLFKQVLGWTAAKIRDPAAADRWTWLIITTHASSGSPARWPPTCACPGNAPPCGAPCSPTQPCRTCSAWSSSQVRSISSPDCSASSQIPAARRHGGRRAANSPAKPIRWE